MIISTAHSRQSKKWRNIEITWHNFARRCAEPVRTRETYAEFVAMSRDQQTQIKDVGGFVGGSLIGTQRLKGCVESRSLITLDIDFGLGFDFDAFVAATGLTCLAYSTHKHTPEAPRLRLVILPNRSLTPAEYEPVARMVAQEHVGMRYLDHTTFEAARMMFWGSCSQDADYFFRRHDGEPLDVDAMLALYTNPLDSAQWPRCPDERQATPLPADTKATHAPATHQADPTEKRGAEGDFCRAYTISQAIDTFLSHIYTPTSIPGRYTYEGGTTEGGLVVYDDKLAYSHHCTDPCSGLCCNAFTLVMHHLFGADKNPYKSMCGMAEADAKVRSLSAPSPLEAANPWMTMLDRRRVGQKMVYESNAKNVSLIFRHDPALAGHIWLNDFTGDALIDQAPWPQPQSLRMAWSDHDDAALRTYFEQHYGIRASGLIADGLMNVLAANSRNPMRQWLESLQWDGVERLERAVITYLGAPDNPLTRAQTRKWMCAAVARIFEPGCKFDNVLMLSGEQGAGKSSFFSILAGNGLHTDSINLRTGDKDTYLTLSKVWIVELAELASVKRSSVEDVKGFISATHDTYRRPFERRTQNVPRHCVFCGTTNEAHFLIGNNGNRRFWCITLAPEQRAFATVPQALKALRADREQLWAEAVHLYRRGETLYLPEHLERQAAERQESLNISAEDPIKATLMEYLNTPVPQAWGAMTLAERREYWQSATNKQHAPGSQLRSEVAPEEFVYECLGLDAASRDVQVRVRRVREYMVQMGWRRRNTQSRFYGGRFRRYERPSKG